MKRKSLVHILIVLFVVALLICLLISINIMGFDKKNKDNEKSKTTTIKTQEVPQVFGDKITDKENGFILINEENKEIKLKVFEAVLGYNIDYLYEFYTPVKINNTTLTIVNNDDHNVFVKIQSLGEDKYYDEYENSLKGIFNHDEELVGYNYNYKFFRGNGLYLKITKCNKEVDINSFISLSLDYMINSIKITKK